MNHNPYFFDTQADNVEPIEITHYECWDEGTTDADIVAAWAKSLGVNLPLDIDVESAAELIAADTRYAAYAGDEFIEIYRRADVKLDSVPGLTEYALNHCVGALWDIWDACESMRLDIGALDSVADAIEAATGERPDGAWRGCPE